VTFRTKVLLAQTPLAVALLFVAFIAVRTTGSLGAGANTILEQNYRSVLAAQRMQDALEALDRAALTHLTGRAPLDPAFVDRNLQRFASQLAIQNANITEPGEDQASARLSKSWDAYDASLKQFRALPAAAAADFYFTDLAPGFVAVREDAERILALNQDAMLRKSDAARDEARRTQTVMIAAAILAVLFGLAAWSVLTERLTHPVVALRTAADRIGGGDFAARVPVIGKDELAQLATTFNSMADAMQRFQHEAGQSERLSSLGRLSTVIAHEIRNPLMIIKASLRALRRQENDPARVAAAAKDIDEEVSRLNRIVSEVLDFARPIKFEIAEADLNALARDAVREFAFIASPLKLRGATGAPMPSYAVPLKS